MGRSVVAPVVGLTRLPSCAVAFLTVLIPTYAHARDAAYSLAASIPILTICMCTFILNDLNDIERDRINHPERALPSGKVSPELATNVYMMLFFFSLSAIVLAVDQKFHYLYYLILLLSVSYNVTVNHFAMLKTLHVATTISVGLLLVARLVGIELDVRVLITAFLFILGRELLMDIEDAAGDGPTVAKRLNPRNGTLAAFALQGLGVATLGLAVSATWEAVAATVIAILLVAIIWGWRKVGRRRNLLRLMQVQMLTGIVFLI